VSHSPPITFAVCSDFSSRLERNVDRYDKVMACDVERFKKFFHGMLQEGVYFAPSAFEAGFLSAAHSAADIEATVAATARVFRSDKLRGKCAPSPGSWVRYCSRD